MEFTEGMEVFRFDGVHSTPRVIKVARVTEEHIVLTTGERFVKSTGKSARPHLAVPYITQKQTDAERIRALFYKKLAEQIPAHPWLKDQNN